MFLAVNFHYVGMPKYPFDGIHGLTPAEFRERLRGLARDFDMIGLPDLVRAARGNQHLPERACLVTFDDGLRCQFEHALPVLEEERIPAAFFVLGSPIGEARAATVHKLHYLRASFGDPTIIAHIERLPEHADFLAVDLKKAQESYRYDGVQTARLKYFLNYQMPPEFTSRLTDTLLAEAGIPESRFVTDFYLDPSMIRTLAGPGMIGAHAWSHAPLARMALAEAGAELQRTRKLLEEVTGTNVSAVSYPLGNPGAVNRTIADLAAEAGYVAGMTMERAVNRSLSDSLLLARIDAADIAAVAELPARSRYFVD
ncbi:hypothetical protein C7U92_07045 [Bradyrhizobium sp. WBOS7]|uniref:Chitooligosaccharide deacetylase n=1 Tax=Bradyrhizobium betae TaxID=244734 RepID=A0AAE9NGZ6_9BRAD|nr:MULTISPECIES: polysaccharide deacetylase family protein [Bradyrhizobium]MDD1569374.1 hypothetical protein [Bradyrhizobium sp. WBOS1]UUO38164.1 hypothetical protein DCK84_28655 [Bradyrhizobium sp. WBOS01]MDD1529847.1 hypothetical protein [Bradyrhizobium sp. WBOS2]MDD1576493.1 hypothetical protein [Bradyrhizobium sp. WBOS7]MDD1602334.1 hypothetical protein [Bradyrhizobium sp. WBOS16]